VDTPDPTEPLEGRNAVFAAYLDAFRAQLADLVTSVSEADAARAIVPSGWTPLELVTHLTHVERRWLVWGFLGEDVGDPWADRRDGRWHVPDGTTRAQLLDALRAQGAVTRRVVLDHDLDETGQPSDRWEGAAPPTLERVCFHLLQEYARHLGHLDVVTELEGRPVG
jgi:hypothetical protein